MEMNPEQHKAVMFQAIAHNLSTVDRDVDLLMSVVKGRRDVSPEVLAQIENGQKEAHRAYAAFLELFQEACGEYASDKNGHMPHSHTYDANNHVHGNERVEVEPLSVVEAALMFTDQAHPYETR